MNETSLKWQKKKEIKKEKKRYLQKSKIQILSTNKLYFVLSILWIKQCGEARLASLTWL